MVAENTFCKLFCHVTETTHRFTYFPADDFRKIWTKNVNRCSHKLSERNFKFFFEKGRFSPKKTQFGVFVGTLPASALQLRPFSLQQIWALRHIHAHYIICSTPSGLRPNSAHASDIFHVLPVCSRWVFYRSKYRTPVFCTILEHQNAFKKRYSEPDASVHSTVERLTPF